MADLSLRNLWKSYLEKTVLEGVSLDVADGEVVTVLGPSGCGKSTLLRLIAGLDRPDTGEIHIGGRSVDRLEPKDRDVAMVFQSYALYPHMTVYDNIAVALRLRRVPAAEVRSRVDAAARSLGIGHHLERRPRELSGGERQRVALARALVREPRVFLLDEPLSNLDALLREHARAELKALFRRTAATVVYVTHDQVEALTLSDRVAVMRAGRLEQVGTPAEIYERPATVFVAGFVGSPRMNLVAGGLLGEEEATTIGIRPEDVSLMADGTLEMEVVLREPLGRDHLLLLRRGTLELRALVPPGGAEGGSVRVARDPRRWHRFDASGRRMKG
jgi:ABC-type sugar transport system ATPase subunit